MADPPSPSVTVRSARYDPTAVGVNANAAPVPVKVAVVSPSFKTAQVNVRGSAAPAGSVADPVKWTAEPTTPPAGPATAAFCGGALVTVTVLASVADPPSPSVTVRVTT